MKPDLKTAATTQELDSVLDLSQHMLILANPTRHGERVLADIGVDYSPFHTDSYVCQGVSSALSHIKQKVDHECRWLTDYLPRDNARGHFVSIISASSLCQVGDQVLSKSLDPIKNIQSIAAMAGQTIKISTFLRIVSVHEQPEFLWNQQVVVESEARIAKMSDKLISDYVNSAEFKFLEKDPHFFEPESKWITSIHGSTSNLGGLPHSELLTFLEELSQNKLPLLP